MRKHLTTAALAILVTLFILTMIVVRVRHPDQTETQLFEHYWPLILLNAIVIGLLLWDLRDAP